MMALDETAWQGLKHAYGTAEDIPEMLREAETAVGAADYQAQPWFDLWSALCHQGDVYSASLAACPHLMRIADQREGPESFQLVVLLASIILQVELNGTPDAPQKVLDDYGDCVGRASSLFAAALNEAQDRSYVTGLLGAIAAINGHPQIGHELAHADPIQECPNCEATFPRFYDMDENYSFADENP